MHIALRPLSLSPHSPNYAKYLPVYHLYLLQRNCMTQKQLGNVWSHHCITTTTKNETSLGIFRLIKDCAAQADGTFLRKPVDISYYQGKQKVLHNFCFERIKYFQLSGNRCSFKREESTTDQCNIMTQRHKAENSGWGQPHVKALNSHM